MSSSIPKRLVGYNCILRTFVDVAASMICKCDDDSYDFATFISEWEADGWSFSIPPEKLLDLVSNCNKIRDNILKNKDQIKKQMN